MCDICHKKETITYKDMQAMLKAHPEWQQGIKIIQEVLEKQLKTPNFRPNMARLHQAIVLMQTDPKKGVSLFKHVLLLGWDIRSAAEFEAYAADPDIQRWRAWAASQKENA